MELLFLFGGVPLLAASVSHVAVPAWVHCEFWLFEVSGCLQVTSGYMARGF